MKRGLFALLLTGTLLLSFSCSTAPELKEATGNQTPEVTTKQNVEPAPTESQPDATSSNQTEPTTVVTKPTETTPEPTETTTQPETTDPSKPSGNTDPVKPTEPTTTAPTTTVPTETTQPTDPQPLLSGWVEQDGAKYYYDSDGSLHTGWLSLDGDRYYFHDDGTMAVGKVKTADSGTRYFTSNGKECILVNPWNYVPDDYSVKLSKYGDYKVAKICLDDLKEMLADCKSAGNKAVVVSAYRSNSYQAGLYERRVQRFVDQGYDRDVAEVEAAKRVAVPGTSEHELGLALDIVDVNYQNLDKKQEDTAAQKWLMANSWKYGFILRYPNNTTEVTGIIYEPWHYRYVGKELAQELHDCGLCLEEYFAQLS